MPDLSLPGWLTPAQRTTLVELATRSTVHSPDVDEAVDSWSELTTVPEFGTEGWWFRWTYAWAPVLLDRDGRALEARLDAAESVPWLLDVVFATEGRVRPYNKYLPWELRHHPLEGWSGEQLLALVQRTLDGDVAAVRETFVLVRAACRAHDERRGHTRTSDMVDGWGDELALFDEV